MEAFRPVLTIITMLILLVSEMAWSYRPPTVSKLKRWMTNISLTVFNSILLYLVFAGATTAAVLYVTTNKVGLLSLFDMPGWLKILATVVFMDFLLYVWHLLNHEMPLLWRFHRVHHSDLNMDVSTATRFHLGELAISAVIKIGLIFFFGVDLLSLVIFETLLNLTAQIQHSSIKVPRWPENIYWVLFVPPSMHRIHHSAVIKERDTNYGTIFSLWDRIFGTLVSDADQASITIGLGAYRKFDKLKLLNVLAMPFRRPVR